jgi:hypothetical protein
MRRLCIGLAAMACVLLVVQTADAERVRSPKKLWSEYPLAAPTTRVADPMPARPLLPPVGAAAARPAADAQSGWLLALAVATAGVVVLLVATRIVAPIVPTVRMPSRPRVRPRTRSRRAEPPTQYAPRSALPEPAPREFVPYVTRRSGLVRSRYVVMVEKEGRTHELRRSRAFWQVGREAWQRRIAEDAWDGLANDLRAEGWEVDTTGRYEYFVPLRRAIVSTLEPYTRFGRKGAAGR